jgi:hypothetical protein
MTSLNEKLTCPSLYKADTMIESNTLQEKKQALQKKLDQKQADWFDIEQKRDETKD